MLFHFAVFNRDYLALLFGLPDFTAVREWALGRIEHYSFED